MKKVLLVQPSLQPPGGGNAVAGWILEALKDLYEVSVLTLVPVDLAAIDRFYGTALAEMNLTAYRVPRFLQFLSEIILPGPPQLRKISLLLHFCKWMQHRYDVVIYAHNEMDVGCRAIQYVHGPWLGNEYRRLRPDPRRPWDRRLWHPLRARYRPWMLISGFSFERMVRNLTLVNSDWTGRKFSQEYGVIPTTVYPPVPGEFPEVSWQDKKNGFVCIGRISREKRMEHVIEVLSIVRSRGHDAHLHIVGTPTPDRDYYELVRRRVQENSSWVFLHENISREALVKLVSNHRYGIHGMADEHFGIAVAELIHGGCIVFTPDDGGQVEIVGRNESLLYRSFEDAAAKIARVIGNEEEQASLHKYLETRRILFSTDRFLERIREIVREQV